MLGTYVVEAAGRQALGQVRGEQEGGEEGQADVVAVEHVDLVVRAALTGAQEQLEGGTGQFEKDTFHI